MAYEKQTWTCGETITADKLNHMEDGIEEASQGGGGGGSASTMESITYAELKAKRDNGTLTPGTQYRITDYVCTTVQEGSRAVSNPYDIIVFADDESTLNENAMACLHDGDAYYSSADHSANLEAWELKYTIDNDASRFAWADATNGKGVVYWLKDDKDNECAYDFKQIQFSRENESVTDWYYTFSVRDPEASSVVSEDASVSLQDGTKCICFGNVMPASLDETTLAKVLNNNVFDNSYGGFCSSNTFGNLCDTNTFGDNCNSNTFGNSCNSNTFGDGCDSNTFGDGCDSNTFGNHCDSNTFGDNCYSNTFGNLCSTNTFGNLCDTNTFGNGCDYINFNSDSSVSNARYYTVLDNTRGTSSSRLTVPVVANNGTATYVGKNSGGTLKVWKPADLVA